MTIRQSLAGIATAAAIFATAAMGQAAAAECIAPADPGGGWDFTCRTVGKLLFDLKLVEEPVQVTNMPGGVGAVAYANVMSKRPSDAGLIVATSTVGVTQIAQGKYPAGTDVMRWIGMLGTDVGVIVVPKDSPYKTLGDLMEAYKKDPGSAVAAGSSGAGGWDHIRLLMLAKAAGMSADQFKQIRWVQFDGGSPAVTQMIGGQVQVVSTDLGEIAGFVESGDVRIIGALSDEPIPAFPDAPTAKSQGLDVTGYNWRGFYTGGEVSDADYQKWVDTMKSLFDSKEWNEAATGNGLIPIWRGGDEFEAYVIDQAAQMKQISTDIGVLQ